MEARCVSSGYVPTGLRAVWTGSFTGLPASTASEPSSPSPARPAQLAVSCMPPLEVCQFDVPSFSGAPFTFEFPFPVVLHGSDPRAAAFHVHFLVSRLHAFLLTVGQLHSRNEFLDAQDCIYHKTRPFIISIIAKSYVIAIALSATRPVSRIIVNPQPTITFASGNTRNSLARQPRVIDHNGRLQ